MFPYTKRRKKNVKPVYAFIFLILGGCLEPMDKDGQPITHGTFRLRTFPTGAKVWIKGELKVESTPATLVLEAGPYALKLQHPGAESMETVITIEAGKHKDRTFNIPKPAPASITVFSDVLGARVRINGYVRGRTPLFQAITKPGPIDMTVTAPGEQSKSIRTYLKLSENKFVEIFFSDVACEPESKEPIENKISMPTPQGYVTLAFKPAGLVFDEDEKEIGTAPLLNHAMPIGLHKLRLQSANKKFERWIKIEVEAEKKHVFRFRLGERDLVEAP